MTSQVIDLTGDPIVEEQIRQYYVKKKLNQVAFSEGVANRERERVQFNIDNSYLHKISADELELYNRNYLKACNKHYKADKIRKQYEERQREEYAE